MRSQQHNQGQLKDLKVSIEKEVVESIERMAKTGGMTVDEIVVIALKRFRASHAELEGKVPKFE